jgi:hypothetical protein
MAFDRPLGVRHRPRTLALASAAIMAALMAVPAAWGQGVRSLGMGGATAPGHASTTNPAFAAVPESGGGFYLPLPLGAANALLRPEFDPRSDQFDLLTVFDQVTHLGSLLVNPARSPDEVVVSISSRDGVPTVALDLIGGAPLQLSEGAPAAFRQSLDLPIGFGFGAFALGVRPFFETDGGLTPGAGFGDLFEQGASSGTIDGRLNGVAGVGVSLAFATEVPMPGLSFPGRIYLGVRAEPFVGLLRVDGTGSLTVMTVENDAGETEFGYSYEGGGFVAAVGQGGSGYGLTGDLGIAMTVPTPHGRLTAGLGVTDLGVAIWNGIEIAVAGDSFGGYSETGPAGASRTYLLDDFGVHGNAALELTPGLLGVPDLASLLIAADAAYDDGLLSMHVGSEAGFDAGIMRLMLRAGLGYDSGFVAGAGAGFRVVGVGLDAAVHTYRSPFTAHQAVGAAIGLGFGF